MKAQLGMGFMVTGGFRLRGAAGDVGAGAGSG